MADMNRRVFLHRGTAALIGCSAAASPWLTTVTLAQGAEVLGDQRLVVVILRGAMDGLDVVRPEGDALYRSYRPNLLGEPGLPLDGIFTLHPRLGGLMPLWQAGELAFVHATSTPYRDKRSHFDGQDILEAGTGLDVLQPEVRDGWLNRMLQTVPGLSSETAYAVGRDALPLLHGAAGVRSWIPDQKLAISAQGRRLLEEVYAQDPLFHAAAMQAMDLAQSQAFEAEIHRQVEADIAMQEQDAGMQSEGQMSDAPVRTRRESESEDLAAFAAGRLRGNTRIAAFSLSGWDSHRNQAQVIGSSLKALEQLILRLRQDLGDVWSNTTVLAMTEFGRTARENGNKGTDHGTGGAMLMAGGAIRGGKVHGRWPGLEEAALYDRRDLMPTTDVRSWAAWTMRGLYGLDRSVLEQAVFPGLQMGDNPGLLR
jgi:uncharacterized protein (DUF1501 family)